MKCVLAGIGLFIGCTITGIEVAIANNDLAEYCDSPFRNPDNNEACEQLERIRRIVIALTVSIQNLIKGFKSCLFYTCRRLMWYVWF